MNHTPDHSDHSRTCLRAYRLLCCICLLVLLCIGPKTVWAQSEENAKALTIAVASDLHLNPDNEYGAITNPLVYYNMEIADALLYDVLHTDADVLLLTGDITDNGSEKAHRALVQKLRTAKARGLKIYVLPGNHDLTARKAAQFPELYKEFGYRDAFSQDRDSLSYSLIINEGDPGDSNAMMILMLDTDGYSNRTNGAYISQTSLSWVEEQLKYASKNHLDLLVAGHYPLLTEQVTEFTGKEALIDLLRKYQVPLYLCGHMHGRSVVYDQGLTELVIEQSISSPCSYALLTKEGENAFRYTPQQIHVSNWARVNKKTAPELLHFEDYTENLFNERSAETVRILIGDRHFSKNKTEKAIEFFRLVQKEHMEGTLPEHKDEILKSPGYKAFMKIADGTTYGRWIPGFIESATPYTAGFRLENYRLSPVNQVN